MFNITQQDPVLSLFPLQSVACTDGGQTTKYDIKRATD